MDHPEPPDQQDQPDYKELLVPQDQAEVPGE